MDLNDKRKLSRCNNENVRLLYIIKPSCANKRTIYSRFGFLAKLAEEHFEEKAETNYEHYKDGVIQSVKYNLAVVNGEPKLCGDTNCDECDFKDSGECVKRVSEWLNQQYKKPTYKLNKFEYDLIQTYSYVHEGYTLSKFKRLIKLKDKGYFKCVDYDTKIQDILANCEVIKR